MASEVEKPRILFFIILVAIEMTGYIFLIATGHEDQAQRIGELLTITVVSIISYYLGWGRRQSTEIKHSANYASKYGHITKLFLYRLAYFIWGVGIALFVQHILCHGWDFELTEILLGHEYIALFCLIAGIVFYKWAKDIDHTTNTPVLAYK